MVEGLGDEIIRSKAQFGLAVGVAHRIGHVFFGQGGNGSGGGELHLGGDAGRAAVEGSAKDVGEAQDVVDLIGVVGAARGDEGVFPRVASFGVVDFRGGVGQGEDDGRGAHGAHHVLGDNTPHGEPDEDVRVHHRIAQGPAVGLNGDVLLVVVAGLPAFEDDAVFIAEHDVGLGHPKGHQQSPARGSGGPGTAKYNAALGEGFAGELGGVHQGSRRDDGGAVLVVVKDRDVHLLPQLFFNVEALRGFDVLEVDPPKGGLQRFDDVDEALGVGAVHLQVEDVDAREALKEDRFALHYRLARQGADVAKPQHRAAVGDDSHEVSTGGVKRRGGGVFLDLKAGNGHPWSVGQGEIPLGSAGFGGDDLDFSGGRAGVILQGQAAAFGGGVVGHGR